MRRSKKTSAVVCPIIAVVGLASGCQLALEFDRSVLQNSPDVSASDVDAGADDDASQDAGAADGAAQDAALDAFGEASTDSASLDAGDVSSDVDVSPTDVSIPDVFADGAEMDVFTDVAEIGDSSAVPRLDGEMDGAFGGQDATLVLDASFSE